MILWNRLKYVLSPQFDIYKELSAIVYGQVADIGFGTGFGTHLFVEKADSVIGFETDKGGIGFATDCFPSVEFTYGDIREGIEGKFDFVIMIDVLEHIRQDKLALQNAKQMLKSEGRLILSTPNRLSRYRKSKNHIREYAPNELEGILDRFFRIVELKDFELKPLTSDYENPIIAICGI